MRKLLLFVFGMMMSFNTINAQSVNGLELKDLDVNYLRIIGRPNFGGNKVVVRFEFGQKKRMLDMKNLNILDSEGRIITFNTMIDALNFISSFGYRLVNASTVASGRTIYEVYIVEKIGLINNQGINDYSNTQNKHYNRSMADSDEEFEEEKAPVEEKSFKERHAEKVENFKKAFSKPSDSKDKNIDKTESETTDTESVSEKEVEEKVVIPDKPQYANCSVCNATGHISSTCTSEGCVKGKLNEKCSVCNGKYSEGNAECFRCEGLGCDYCGYDGKACDACKEGMKSSTHSVCNGTGEIVKDCTKCAGTGKVKL